MVQAPGGWCASPSQKRVSAPRGSAAAHTSERHQPHQAPSLSSLPTPRVGALCGVECQQLDPELDSLHACQTTQGTPCPSTRPNVHSLVPSLSNTLRQLALTKPQGSCLRVVQAVRRPDSRPSTRPTVDGKRLLGGHSSGVPHLTRHLRGDTRLTRVTAVNHAAATTSAEAMGIPTSTPEEASQGRQRR